MAPPNSSSFSVSVVLPASGWEMMAKVRRRATSSDSGDRDGDSAGTAVSDMNRAFGRENRRNQGRSGDCGATEQAPYPAWKDDLPITTIRGDDPAFCKEGLSWLGLCCSPPVCSKSVGPSGSN